MAKQEKTLVTLLLDRSGSMQSVKSATVEAVNSYISHLKGGEEDIRMSLVLFDSPYPGDKMDLEKIFVGKKIDKVALFEDKDFMPRGGTPLIDAAYTTIRAVESSLVGKSVKVVIAIQTDGNERDSRENSWDDLRSLIKEKEEAGWQFNFLGAGMDAYKQGSRMGLSPANTMSYGKDKEATKSAFEATAVATRAFASGMALSTSYTAEQKAESGDLWVEK